MDGLSFEWDSEKAESNLRKHGVSFEEARTVFADESGRLIADPDHSDDEDRFILLGLSANFGFWWLPIATGRETPFASSPPARPTSVSGFSTKDSDMRESYDFSKSIKNPYAKRLKRQVTIRLDEETIAYFKSMAEEKGLPYQSLINLYLRDCAVRQRELTWG
ncbi:MAG: BrnT family toxin [Xanthomonadales bacterium]|nr:BrnT family toxin [Xanthomonadales bacterium]